MNSPEKPDDGSHRIPASHGETTNHSLIDLVRQHDPDAWNTFVGIYQPLVQHWSRCTGLKGTDVEDVCQNVFASVSTSIASYRKRTREDTFRGWLRTITRNRIADFLRLKSTEVPPLHYADVQTFLAQLSEPEPPPATNPESRKASVKVYRNALEAVRAKVEERTWQAFWRTTVDEQSAADVADELGMTVVAVRKAKFRMKVRLRLELGSLFDEITRDAGVALE